MRIILLKDVPMLGQKGDICEVKPGYGLNFLIPQKLAQIANQDLISQLQRQKEISQIKQKKQEDKLSHRFEKLKQAKIIIKAKTNEKGILFGSVSAADIAGAIKKDLGFAISAKSIKIEKAIKKTGHWLVEVDSGHKIIVKVKVEVVAD